MAPTATAPHLSDQQLVELLAVGGDADSVELKLTGPESDHYAVAAALGSIPWRPSSVRSTSSTRPT